MQGTYSSCGLCLVDRQPINVHACSGPRCQGTPQATRPSFGRCVVFGCPRAFRDCTVLRKGRRRMTTTTQPPPEILIKIIGLGWGFDVNHLINEEQIKNLREVIDGWKR